jgi:hypothetical protein
LEPTKEAPQFDREALAALEAISDWAATITRRLWTGVHNEVTRPLGRADQEPARKPTAQEMAAQTAICRPSVASRDLRGLMAGDIIIGGPEGYDVTNVCRSLVLFIFNLPKIVTIAGAHCRLTVPNTRYRYGSYLPVW